MRLLLLNLLLVLGHFIVPLIEGAPAQSSPPAKKEKRTISCALCNLIVYGLFQSFDQGLSNEEIVDSIVKTCSRLNIYSAEICQGAASIAMPSLRYIHNSTEVVAGNVCGILMQSSKCALSDPDKLEWTVKPSSVPKPLLSLATLPQEEENSPTIKVLHLADPHWDPKYLEGSNANCGDPLCCRASSGNVTDSSDAAGYWGDYRSCDMPWRTIEKAVEHMAQQHSDAAYIIWTGDLVPHDNWSTDKEEKIMISDRLLSLMKKYFPKTPLYPTLGNHEAHPVNAFAPTEVTDEEFSTAWLYKVADDQWAKWLPTEVSSTVRHGGYYTTLAQPGLRIVSMNLNYCYTYNWWLMLKSQDPASGLLWLNAVLEEAEKNGEKVHIISHIPPGNNDCLSIFSREFSKIINRFESTVAAQFYGHTHNDEFRIFYDSANSTRPVNLAFIAGSLSPYSDLNPGYRVYMVDGPRPNSSWAVLDFSSWVMNLTAANLKGAESDPVWFELYQARKEYGLFDLSPESMNNLFHRMLIDDALFELYYKNYHKATDMALAQECDEKCRKNLLCTIVTTDIADQRHCEGIPTAFKSQS